MLTMQLGVDTAVVDYVDEYIGAQPRHIFPLCAMAEKPIQVTEPWEGPSWCAERLKENEGHLRHNLDVAVQRSSMVSDFFRTTTSSVDTYPSQS